MNAECSTQPSDIWKQVNQFLQGGSRSGSQGGFEGLSSSALFLLRSVPVARHAVLEHYANVFDEVVNTYLSSSEMGSMAVQENHMVALQDVTSMLLSFIKSNPEAWAPVVSSWSLSLLGQVSSKYAARRGIQHATSLNEVLQMWMACPPVKMLIEISTDCFAAILPLLSILLVRVGGAPDRCVDSLLEASVRFSPHFDWVVAHIGSCFPTTIITRVLNCGLKDFCTSSPEGLERDMAASNRMKIPKMASVVGILGHLASRHGPDIRTALMNLFKASLTAPSPTLASSSTSNQQVTTLPFLLQLASMSPMLLNVLTTDLVSALTPSVLNKIHNQFTHWKRSSPSEYNSFLNLVVHLIGKSSTGAFVIINFILVTAFPDETSSGEESPCEAVKDTCAEIIHILLFELQRGVMFRKMDGSVPEIPLLVGLATNIDLLTSTLFQSKGKRLDCFLKLATFTGLHASQETAASMLAYIVCHSKTPQQLSSFYKLKSGLEMGFPSVVKSAMSQIFNTLNSSEAKTEIIKESSSHPPILQIMKNLEDIVTVEKSKFKGKALTSSMVIAGVRDRHGSLMELLLGDDEPVCASALRLMSTAGFPKDINTCLLTKLCAALASSLFTSLHQRSQQTGRCPKLLPLTMDCIRQLSSFPFTKSILIHYLVEGAVDVSNSSLFGGKEVSTPISASSLTSSLADTNLSLLDQNKAQKLSISLPRSHSSVYHGGVIQQNRRMTSSSRPISKTEVWENRASLIEMLWSCCREANHPTIPPVSQNSLPTASVTTTASDKTTAASVNKEEPMDTSNGNGFNNSTPTPSTSNSPTPNGETANLCVISESAGRTLGCVLVDILTQDSLYNDVCWPDLDFRKVTMERDILVWKKLDQLSFLWEIIEEFSPSCVFLYYLSPVLRSITGVLMNCLEGCREQSMTSQPKEYEAAIKLVACLRKGLLLPSPLSNISELFPFVSPYEGFMLLSNMWQFIKDNPPTEFEFDAQKRACDASHTQLLSSIVHANIHKMGHLCSRVLPT